MAKHPVTVSEANFSEAKWTILILWCICTVSGNSIDVEMQASILESSAELHTYSVDEKGLIA